MTEPEPESTQDASCVPPTVRVPTRLDVFGNPTDYIDADPAAAGQWDETCWSDRPPS